MKQTKNKERPNQPKFTVGEEIICKINGERGYVILPFRTAVVAFKEGKSKVIPEDNLILSEPKAWHKKTKTFFVKGDNVEIIPERTPAMFGQVIDSKWFYVLHIYKTGEVKVALAEILIKSSGKIIPFRPLGLIKISPKNLPRFG